MARFRLTKAFQAGQYHLHAGQTLADSAANAQPGDAVWTGLNSSTMGSGFTPLDASANTMKAGSSKFASESTLVSITGRDSIDA
jgi:hypothetical protein